jgi:hypothetical protein
MLSSAPAVVVMNPWEVNALNVSHHQPNITAPLDVPVYSTYTFFDSMSSPTLLLSPTEKLPSHGSARFKTPTFTQASTLPAAST